VNNRTWRDKDIAERFEHQEIVETLVKPDRFDNTKSGRCRMVSLNIELA
jgi:hypothetical protein